MKNIGPRLSGDQFDVIHREFGRTFRIVAFGADPKSLSRGKIADPVEDHSMAK